MIKNFYKIGANIVFIALCISIILLTLHCRKMVTTVNYHKKVNEVNEEIAQGILNEKITEFYENEGIQIDPSFQLYSFNEQDSVPLSSITTSGKYLVLRISRDDCNTCVDSLYKALDESLKGYDSKRVILFIDEIQARKIIVYQRIHGVSYRVYGVDKGKLPISFETETPYLFVLDESLSAQMIHQFSPRNQSLTIKYLEIISQRYLKYQNFTITNNE